MRTTSARASRTRGPLRTGSAGFRIPRVAAATAAAALLAGTMLAVSACSQMAALAPVSEREAEVRFATIDILLRHEVEILIAPDCGAADASGTIRCVGWTMDAVEISAVSTGDSPADVTVKVGDDTLYAGPTAAVLEEAMLG